MNRAHRPTPVSSFVKKIRIEGHGKSRTITCPYCSSLQKVTLVPHLKRHHPSEWRLWGEEFVSGYNDTNDLKRVMRAFTNAEGQLVLSWTSIESEIRRLTSIKGITPRFRKKTHISRWEPTPEEYSRFSTTVWDIPIRGTWSVHQSTYRGNWPPQVPRALIELYSKPGDLVLDPFVGGGTTLVEAWALGRHAIGLDVSPNAIAMTNTRLSELDRKANRETLFGLPRVDVQVELGDARKLQNIIDESVDLICTHPPYADAVQYTHNEPNDLSLIKQPSIFLDELFCAAKRFHAVLKPEGVCAILIGDLRREGRLYSLGLDTMARFRDAGFEVIDIVVKTQNNERSAEFHMEKSYLRIRHEYLLIFRKPMKPRDSRGSNV